MSFVKGLNKIALGGTIESHLVSAALSAGVGALGGGENDRHGNVVNRHIGAGRGAAFSAGWSAAAELAHAAGAKPLLTLQAGLAGGIGGYFAAKHLGSKYKHQG